MKLVISIMGRPQAVEVHEALVRNERNQPWIATLDSYEGGDPVGWGDTTEEAIDELINEIEWRNDGDYSNRYR